MPSLILYSANKQLTRHHHMVPAPVYPRLIYVRAEMHPGNLLDALDAARPMDGETVLNAIPAEA